jgi:PrsW family intramembrane metalloprotease
MRVRRVSSFHEMEQVIDEYITLGYRVERGVETALLKKSGLLRTIDQVLLKIEPNLNGKPREPLTVSSAETNYYVPPVLAQADAERFREPYLYPSSLKDRRVSLSHFNQVDLLIALASLFWGMMAGVILALPLEVVLNAPMELAAFIEEPVKILPLIVVAIWYPYLLYSKKKCAVFGAIAGLGFGAVENLWYFVNVPHQILETTVIIRTVFLPGHLMYSAIAAMSLMYIASRRQRYYTVLLLSLAMVFHVVWNSVFPAIGIYIILYVLIIVLFILIYRIVPDQVIDPYATPVTLDELIHKNSMRSL